MTFKSWFTDENFFKTLNGSFALSDIHNSENISIKGKEILKQESEVYLKIN